MKPSPGFDRDRFVFTPNRTAADLLGERDVRNAHACVVLDEDGGAVTSADDGLLVAQIIQLDFVN